MQLILFKLGLVVGRSARGEVFMSSGEEQCNWAPSRCARVVEVTLGRGDVPNSVKDPLFYPQPVINDNTKTELSLGYRTPTSSYSARLSGGLKGRWE